MEKRTKESRKRINSLILLIAFTAIMLIVSTYAWFTSQKDITLSNLQGTVEVAENMEISLDAKTWSQNIDLKEAATVFATAQTSRNEALDEDDEGDVPSTALAVLPTQLLPVSGTGETSYTTMPLYSGKATSTTLSDIAKCAEVASDGYFAFDIYIKNTSKDGENDILQLNLNSQVRVLPETVSKTFTDTDGNEVTREYKGDATSGLQNTVRVALARYTGTITSTATQVEILNSTKAATVSDVAIWEPNAYDHVEYIWANNNKLTNGSQALSKFGMTSEVTTYAINSDGPTGTKKLENVYDIGDSKLSEQVTLKTGNNDTLTAQNNYRITASDGSTLTKPVNITNVSGTNFEIESNKVTRYRVYVWLEGQDVDCINIASQGGGIEVDLGLTKDDFIGDVMSTTI